MAQQYWYDATRWDDTVIMLTPDEGKEAAVQHMLGGVYKCDRLKSTVAMKDFSTVEVSAVPYFVKQERLDAGEEAAPLEPVIMTDRGALCRYVKKLVKPRKGDPAYHMLHRDDAHPGFVWAVRTQTLTESTRRATKFPDSWVVLEPWEEDLMLTQMARR